MAVDTDSFGRGCWLIATLLCVVLPSHAADLALVYSGGAVAPGGSVAASIVVTPGESAPVALQFDLEIDNQWLSLAPLVDDSLVQLLLYVNREVAPGKVQISLSNVLAVDKDGQPVDMAGQGMTLSVEASGSSTILLSKAVRNAASLLPSSIAPGELITILGSGLRNAQDGELVVLFDGKPGVVLYAGANQVNVATPLMFAGQSVTHLQILADGVSRADGLFPVADSAPGLFVSDATGTGALVALNEDGTANSAANPARVGSVITLFATGLGLADRAPNGTLQLHAPLSISVGGEVVESSSVTAGPADGIVSIRTRIPADIPAGWEIPVTLNVSGAASQIGATLSVQ
jgi:uncharacterized protein (TIGR03437 family)